MFQKSHFDPLTTIPYNNLYSNIYLQNVKKKLYNTYLDQGYRGVYMMKNI